MSSRFTRAWNRHNGTITLSYLDERQEERRLISHLLYIYYIRFLRKNQIFMAEVAGFGPANAGVKVLCLTAWRHPNIREYFQLSIFSII